jgi:hypothetical protein
MIRLFRIFVPLGVITLLLSEIVLIASAYVAAAYLVFDYDPTVFLLYDRGLIRIGIVVLTILVGFHFKDLYTNIKVTSRGRLIEDLCVVIAIATFVQGLIGYLMQGMALPLRLMVLGSAISLGVLFFWRQFHSAYVLQVVGDQRILFLGCNPVVQEIAAHLRAHPELGIRVEGCLHNSVAPGGDIEGVPVLGPVESLRRIVNTQKPDLIVVGLSERRDRMPVQDLLDLRFAGFRIEEAAATYEAVCGRICTKELRPAQLIFTSELGPGAYGRRLQPLLDILIAVTGAIVTAPIMLLTAIAVKLSSPGPVFYKQVRTGLEGTPFLVYKFRSMYTDAEARTGAVWASKDDPRITRVGKWLRRLRLDELPQFFNVLRGEMAIIGPRPERPEFVQTRAADSLLQTAAVRAAGRLRLGADQPQVRRYPRRHHYETRIRPVLHQAHVVEPRFVHHPAHVEDHAVVEGIAVDAGRHHGARNRNRYARRADSSLPRRFARRRRSHLRLCRGDAPETVHRLRGSGLPERGRSGYDRPHHCVDLRTAAGGVRPRADPRLRAGLAHAAIEGIDVGRGGAGGVIVER